MGLPPSGGLRELGCIRAKGPFLELLGAPQQEEAPETAVGEEGMPPAPGRQWWLRASCGLEFVLWQNFVTEDLLLVGDETAELAHIVAHLPFDCEVLSRFPPVAEEEARRAGRGGWQLWRIDDRGNRFDLERFSRENSARCYASLLEARGHKQSYFFEQKGPLPALPPTELEPHRWALVRQDDHGRRYLVTRGASRVALEFLAERFNREPRHKQLFVVERYEPQATT
ncbi:hypothetical protein [Hyalangium rubrum]|uniref:Uncharacterized protein n=1 Tax=Hyalangium rubrum TaxID=3103134 RepID=A0ABU5GVH0_9BACT|nr:hypothetical protein [Hyalangium sp. s54d21]MDY7224902.1 hypothetical protein [Hyalangium sp. s54d21]